MAGRKLGEAFVEVDIRTGGTDATLAAARAQMRGLGEDADSAERKVRDAGRGMNDAFVKVGVGAKVAANQVENAAEEALRLGLATRDAAGKLRDLDGKFLGAARTAKILEDNAAGVGRQFVALGAEAKVAAKAVDDLGDQLAQAGRKGGGGKGGFLGFFADVAPEAGKAGAQAANTFSSAFQGGLLSAFRALPPEVQGILVASLLAIGTAVAPLLATMVSGAIIAGVGGGALVSGIVLAARAPAVQAAFKDLGTSVMGQLTEAAKPFESQLVRAAGIFQSAFAQVSPGIKSIFSDMATAITPIAEGLAGMAINSMPGIVAAAQAAVPMFKAIGAELPALGAALSSLLENVAAVGPQATAVFVGIIKTLEIGLVGLGDWLNMMGQIAGGAQIVGNWITSWIPGMQAAGDSAGLAAGPMIHLGQAVGDVGAKANETSDDVLRLSETINGAIDKSLDMAEATLRWNESMTRLKAELSDGARTLDQHTEAGQRNAAALLASARAAEQQYAADVALHGVTQSNTAAFNAAVDAIIAAAVAAGFDRSQVEGLIGALRKVPAKTTAEVALQKDAFDRGIAQANQALNSINGRVASATVVTHYVTEGTRPGQFNADGNIYSGSGRVRRFAAGGEDHSPQIGWGTRIWGEPETGGEAYLPLGPAKRSRSLALLSQVATLFGRRLTGQNEGGPGRVDTARLEQLIERLIDVCERQGAEFGAVLNGAGAGYVQTARAR